MLHNTRGIVFHQVKYSETSMIVRIYTELFGLQSYLIRGIRSKKSKIKPALLQHLSLLDLIVYHKEKKDIQNIKEVKIAYPYKTIPYEIKKSSVAVFLNEVLYKVIREQEANPELFAFLFNSLQILDLREKGISDFYLIFLIRLTKYLGFFPKNNFSVQNCNFNLEEGLFNSNKEPKELIVNRPYSEYLSNLTESTYENSAELKILPQHRSKLLEVILNYYQLHIPVIMNIKSHHVLQTVLN